MEESEENCCANCGNTAKTMCGKCKLEYYCGKDCQVAHWKVHKVACKKNSATSSASKQAAVASAKPALTPLCGRGYYQWLFAQNGSLKKSGPQYIERPTVGLQNQENTCYLNAVLQCLLHTTLLRECLMQACPQPRSEEEWLVELMQLFKEVDEAKGSRTSLSASRIASLITMNKEFARGQQADAHEALMLILSRLLDDCLAVGDGSGRALADAEYAAKEQLERSSLVGHVFGMDLGQTVRCDSCNYTSTTARVEYCCCLNSTLGMSDRELEALQAELQQQVSSSSYLRSRDQETSAPETTLESLMSAYMKGEHIEGYKCEKCKRSGCTRSAYLARRPNILVAYIDRRQDAGLYGKINRRVRFQQRLDLSPFVDFDGATSNQYSLYAIVVHRDVNRSTFFGHYVAYVRDRTSQWYLLDDTRVEQVTWSVVQEQHAYLLLYSADHVLPPQSPAAKTPASPSQPERPRGAAPPAPAAAREQPLQPRSAKAASTGSCASSASTRSTVASSASSPRSCSDNSTASTQGSAPSPSEAAAAAASAPSPPPSAAAAASSSSSSSSAPEEEVPAAQEEAPAAQEEAPAAQEEAPSAHEVAPSAQAEAAAAQGEAPAAQEEAPAAQEEALAAQEEAPAAHEEAPTAQDLVPAAEEEAPLAQEDAPAAQEVAPVEQEAVHDPTAAAEEAAASESLEQRASPAMEAVAVRAPEVLGEDTWSGPTMEEFLAQLDEDGAREAEQESLRTAEQAREAELARKEERRKEAEEAELGAAEHAEPEKPKESNSKFFFDFDDLPDP